LQPLSSELDSSKKVNHHITLVFELFTFFYFEDILAFVDNRSCPLGNAARRIKVLQEFRMWRREWIFGNICNDSAVKKGLLNSMERRIVRKPCVKPGLTVSNETN
jgi:hypothetical protein